MVNRSRTGLVALKATHDPRGRGKWGQGECENGSSADKKTPVGEAMPSRCKGGATLKKIQGRNIKEKNTEKTWRLWSQQTRRPDEKSEKGRERGA